MQAQTRAADAAKAELQRVALAGQDVREDEAQEDALPA
jgi:hypothetical protein